MAGAGCIGLFRKWSSWRRGGWRRRCWILRATLKEGLMKSENSCGTLDFWAELPYELGCSLYRKDHMIWSSFSTLMITPWSNCHWLACHWQFTNSFTFFHFFHFCHFWILISKGKTWFALGRKWEKVRKSQKLVCMILLKETLPTSWYELEALLELWRVENVNFTPHQSCLTSERIEMLGYMSWRKRSPHHSVMLCWSSGVQRMRTSQ